MQLSDILISAWLAWCISVAVLIIVMAVTAPKR
jgi:hypothetical protein